MGERESGGGGGVVSSRVRRVVGVRAARRNEKGKIRSNRSRRGMVRGNGPKKQKEYVQK